jgi:myo-inositol-1(or 4)-monophosphatase
MDDFITAVREACLEIRTAVCGDDEALFVPHTAGHGGDISSEFDLRAEEICFRHLSPYGSVFSEESGWMSPKGEINIICDPIDGSDNFASAFPYYGVSIAREIAGETRDGIVCNLANGDFFVRTPYEYYRSSLDHPTLKSSIFTFPYPKIGLFEKSAEHPALIKVLMEEKLKFRSPGALALSLAYAPYVNYVLFLGTMRPYDIQAGLYLSRHLYTFQDDHIILLSRDEEVFERIRAIVQKEIF